MVFNFFFSKFKIFQLEMAEVKTVSFALGTSRMDEIRTEEHQMGWMRWFEDEAQRGEIEMLCM